MSTFNGSAPSSTASSNADAEIIELLTLHHSCRLSLQTPLQVVSAHPFKIGDLTIWSTAPIHVTASSTIELASTAGLGTHFAHGWNKLSDELKARILVENLIMPRGIDVDDFHGASDDCPAAFKAYLDCLRSTPEIAALAKQVFYSRNTFLICPTLESPSSGQGTSWTVAYPHRDVCSSITRLAIQVGLFKKGWNFLRDFRDLVMNSFANIKYVKIILINWPGAATNPKSWQQFSQVSWEQRAAVTFACKGEFVLPSADRFGVQGFTESQSAELQPILQKLLFFDLGKWPAASWVPL
jgi:hypothetical protein